MPPLLLLQNIHTSLGGTVLLDGAELGVSAGERLCLVGRNGSGKSTLLKIAAGLLEPDGGTRFLQPGATIRYLPQEPDLAGYETSRAYVEAGLMPGDDSHRATYLLTHLGLSGAEAPHQLSGGEARRAALARVLAPSPDILLLDEPTNHLDLPAIAWLERELGQLRSALVLISHDRRFLDTLSRTTLWLDRGRTRRLDQGFSGFESWRDTLLEQEELERHKLDRQIAREEDWVRYGVSGRRKRNQRRMAALSTLRQERRAHRNIQGTAKITLSESTAASALLIKADHLVKAYDGRTIVSDVSLRVRRGDRIGIVGANGTGKTTLLKLLTGALTPDSGTLKHPPQLTIATLDQSRATLEPNATVSSVLTGGAGETVSVAGQARHVVSYMKDFLFAPEQARSPVRLLSGGERARLLIAKALAVPSDLLVLDEPTNDLDLETLDLLQEMLADYAGTVLLVSHDRDFLDRVATSILMAEGDGRFAEYAGGYSDMLAQRGKGVREKAPMKAPSARIGAASPMPPKQAARRLSFKDKHALEALPKQMATLEGQIARLQLELANQDLYTRDPARFAALAAQLTQRQGALHAAEEQWLALELLREEIEAEKA